MLVAALETEAAAYLEAHRGERDDEGHALVVRNGKGRTRRVTVGAGTIAVSAPVSTTGGPITLASGNDSRVASCHGTCAVPQNGSGYWPWPSRPSRSQLKLGGARDGPSSVRH
jgi:hypothetical protein